MERIQVAPDHWTFREAVSHRPFVPFGVNYTPAWAGWAPDYLSAETFSSRRIARDFRRMRELGVNVCKVVFPGIRVLPDPQSARRVHLDPGTLARFDQMLDIAGRNGIRLIVTLGMGWRGMPAWFDRAGNWYGQTSRVIHQKFWHKLVSRHAGDGRIMAYSFSVEVVLHGWNSPDVLIAWREWARTHYPSLKSANRSWGTRFTRWDAVASPGFDGCNSTDWRKHPEGTDENENRTDDPFLYDYLLFREYTAFRFMHAQALAVRNADPGALTTMGFIQWSPLLRELWHPTFESPAHGPDYNIRELAKIFDFVGIHFYPVLPGARDLAQLKYLELWSRWAHSDRPVVLEEFNAPPAERNLKWCPRVIRHSRRFVSGWLTWTFQDVPNSDQVTEVCGLFGRDGKPTAWAEKYRTLAAQARRWRLQRQPAVRSVPADKRFLYTSGRYREFLESLLAADTQTVDFAMEENPSIVRLLRKKPIPPCG